MKKRHYIVLATVAILIFLFAFLYQSTGFFQSARIDEADLKAWNYVDGKINGTEAFVLNGSSGICWLMIHSYVATPAEFTDIANRVNLKFNDTVSVPRLSGHGEVPSSLIGKDLYSWYSEMEKEFKGLDESCSQVNVLGSSFGGALALRLAENEDFSRLYLVNAFVDKSSSWYKVVPFETRLHFASPFLYYNRKSKVAQINDPEGLEKHIAYWTMPYQPVLSSIPFLVAVRADAPKISVPTLAIHSKNDKVADFEKLKEVFNDINSEDKELMYRSRSNHVLLFDYDREEVMNRIISFEESRR